MLRPFFKVRTHVEEFGEERDQQILDPELIARCGSRGFVLLTADGDLEFTHAAEIRSAKIAVFTVTNNHEGPDKWGPRIINAKEEILRELDRRPKPFSARITVKGEVNKIRRFFKKTSRVIHVASKAPKSAQKGAVARSDGV